MENWFGEEYHITDEYIHWNDRDPKKRSIELRKAWDKLANCDKEELEILLKAAYNKGVSDEFEINCPDL